MISGKQITGFMLAAALTLQPFLLAAQDASKAPAPAATPVKMNPIGLPDFTQGRPVKEWYRPFDIASESPANGPRIEQLFHDGKIQLSLQDAIMLAIENNLDVAIQRLNAPIADTDILRTKAGVGSRVGQAFVSSGSALGVSGGTFASAVSSAPLFGGAPGFQTGGTTSFDPYLTSTFSVEHNTILSTQSINQFSGASGGSSSVSIITGRPNTAVVNFGYSQAFVTGTQLNVAVNDSRSTSPFNSLSPQINSAFTMTATQHLLDGFGRGPNVRSMIIAKNNREVGDLVFKLQLITTVSQVQSLYWDLVGAQENIKVQQRSLQVSEKLYNDNKRQVEIGTLAPIEVVRAEAEVASGRQNLIVAQTNYQQLSTYMKNMILRNISDPAILTAQVVPTDKISVPPAEPVIPIQEMVSNALNSRVELQQSRINISNRDLSIKTTKNSLLPQVDAFGTWASRGVGGLGHVVPCAGCTPVEVGVGGLGTSLPSALLGRNPDYTVGLQMTVPLRNRSAQADLAEALLEKRQAGIRMQQLENQVRVEVANAQIALQQSRAQIDAAIKQRELAERSLDAEQKKFQLGASTNYLVIQAQRDLTTALSSEVSANNAYMKARVELNRATGQTLSNNNIMVDEAFQGQLKHAPTPIPVSRQDNN